ncbi:MAG: phage tail protein [Bacteroidetes bacterium]|nr:phage tail protein [Bacteroidota bacterium]
MDGYVGEIKISTGYYAPLNWEYCNGRTMPIDRNVALFSILGTMYGGDGTSNFNLPNETHLPPLPAGSKAKYIICINGSFPSRV